MARAPETPDRETAPSRPAGTHSVIPSRSQFTDLARSSREFRDEQNTEEADALPAIDHDDPNRPYVGLSNPFAPPADNEGEGEPEPAPEPAPAAAPQPAAAPDGAPSPDGEPAGEPAMADPNQIVEIVVNGQTHRMTVRDLQERGQKVVFADQYYDAAKSYQQQLREQGLDPRSAPQPAAQPAAQPQRQAPTGGPPTPAAPADAQTPGATVTPEALGIDSKALYDAFAYGDEETGVALFNAAFQKVIDFNANRDQGHQLDASQLRNEMLTQVRYDRMLADATKEVVDRYGMDFFQDPDALTLANRRFQALGERAEIEGKTFEFGSTFMQAADEVATRLGFQPKAPGQGVPQPAPTPTPAANPLAARQAAKRDMDTPPPAATGRAPLSPADSPMQGQGTIQQRSAAVERMAQARGSHATLAN